MTPHPHEGVYTRLKPSGIHGIGVFAIRRILKSTIIFLPKDTGESVIVHEDNLKTLPPEVQQLYRDYCVAEGDGYWICPVSFNLVSVPCYVNYSETPNIACDSDLKTYALRDIDVGEELTLLKPKATLPMPQTITLNLAPDDVRIIINWLEVVNTESVVMPGYRSVRVERLLEILKKAISLGD